VDLLHSEEPRLRGHLPGRPDSPGGVPGNEPFALRRAEDRAACKLVGASAVHATPQETVDQAAAESLQHLGLAGIAVSVTFGLGLLLLPDHAEHEADRTRGGLRRAARPEPAGHLHDRRRHPYERPAVVGLDNGQPHQLALDLAGIEGHHAAPARQADKGHVRTADAGIERFQVAGLAPQGCIVVDVGDLLRTLQRPGRPC